SKAIEAGESACTIGKAVGDTGLRVVANYYLGVAHWFAGDPSTAAADALRASIALIEGAPLGERFGLTGMPAVFARGFLAAVLAERGDFAGAIAAGEAGLRIAKAADHSYSEGWARWGLGC